MFVCEKASYRVVPVGSPIFFNKLAELIQNGGRRPPLTGSIICPKGCGTIAYWALSADMLEHKEQFLNFLHQQLSWTSCPQHEQVQPQTIIMLEPDWTFLPPASTVLGRGRRYANCYE